jgi:hypothetical protein
MPFENVSKRKLTFAPKNLVLGEDQKELKIALHETNFSHTERIVAPNKMIFMVSNDKPGEFEKLPELTYIEGNLSLPEGITVLASKLTKIEGDLQVGVRARFYAPLLQDVTGFIYIGIGATVNAPKVEHLLANDDTSKINEQSSTPDWLHSL